MRTGPLILWIFFTAHAQQWPSFRGPSASGVAFDARLPLRWNTATGENIRWKTSVPGLAHSSPIVAGDRVFLTTAVSSKEGVGFKKGLYGAGTASDDISPQELKVLCYSLRDGNLLWSRTAYSGPPKEKRHVKSTYASATPVTDGRIVAALFGSHGLYAYTVDGKPLWSRDLGRMDVGAYDAPDYEWGTASSPIMYRDLVIVQADMQKGSFLIAVEKRTGKVVWRTERDELPSWGTPTVFTGGNRDELVTNASRFVRGYDPSTGKELWRLGGSSKITAPTPVFGNGIIVVASGRRPEAPIFAIKPGASGAIDGTSGKLAWKKNQRGPYMPTPLILGEYLYSLNNPGVFDCYRLATGEEIYRERIPHAGSGFSSSPVAADGIIYIGSEDGTVSVIQAGPQFKLLTTNDMGEAIMATPAIARRTLLVRTERHLIAVGSAAATHER
ncbi:MAG TPA: PQQ-binding-like beta-propeller repeat protein [Bryobacteraceae bacterium]|nr:PQQ-binding-like beta-propeller repeat protein [Bryobacteraceae bacterium]